jgi:hypothetical protein
VLACRSYCDSTGCTYFSYRCVAPCATTVGGARCFQTSELCAQATDTGCSARLELRRDRPQQEQELQLVVQRHPAPRAPPR